MRIARPGFFLAVRAYDRSGRVHFQTALPTLPVDLPKLFERGPRAVDTAEGAWQHLHARHRRTASSRSGSRRRPATRWRANCRCGWCCRCWCSRCCSPCWWRGRCARGLAPLDEASRRVSDRDASRLDPLPVDNVPEELLPLVEQINALLARLSSSLGAERRFSPTPRTSCARRWPPWRCRCSSPSGRSRRRRAAAAFEELRHGIERARRLVQQLLDYARLEPGMATEVRLRVNLATLAREVVGAFSARAEELDVDLGADAPVAVSVDGTARSCARRWRTCSTTRCVTRPRTARSRSPCGQQGDRARVTVIDAGPAFRLTSARASSGASTGSPATTRPASASASPSSRPSSSATAAAIMLRDANGGSPAGLAVQVELARSLARAAGQSLSEPRLSQAYGRL